MVQMDQCSIQSEQIVKIDITPGNNLITEKENTKTNSERKKKVQELKQLVLVFYMPPNINHTMELK